MFAIDGKHRRKMKAFHVKIVSDTSCFRSKFKIKKVKVKQSLYTPWKRLGGEEV
jgi:hypothetical protein